MTSPPGALRSIARAAALAIVILLAPLGAPTVSAHTDFESSSPADGDVVAGPVETVTIVFTKTATPVGEQFVALAAGGTPRTPNEVVTSDGRAFVLSFDPPLAGGGVGVRWEVQAGDAHPIAGAFSFTAGAPPPAPTPAAAPTTTTATVVADGGTPTTTATVAADGGTPPTTAAAATDHASPTTTTAAAATNGAEPAASTPERHPMPAGEPSLAGDDPATHSGVAHGDPTPSLDEFLSAGTERAGDTLALTGRVIGLIGVALALGGLAFLALAHSGSRREVMSLFSTVRFFGAVIAAGAIIEYVGVSAMAGASVSTGWATSPGRAAALRVLGGLAILGCDKIDLRRDPPARPAHSLSAAVLEHPPTERMTAHDRYRWHWGASSAALIGAGLVIVSFWFDGHTVSEGPRLLHIGVNSVHILAGSVWAGGVGALALTVWRRRRRGQPTRAAELVVRFSSVASIALTAVLAAGVVMAIFVLDSVGDVVGTEWGRTLMIKSGGVATAALLGAYNHFRILPRLRAGAGDERIARELRISLTVEAIVLVFVLVVTAWLVAAAT